LSSITNALKIMELKKLIKEIKSSQSAHIPKLHKWSLLRCVSGMTLL